MMRYGLRAWGIAGVAAVACVAWQSAAWGVNLDKDGSMRLGVRAYVNARIQAEHTDRTVEFSKANPNGPANNVASPGMPANLPVKTLESQTFPYSPPGHLRQNRMFIEAEFEHDLTGLMKTFGPLPLLENLPFEIYTLKYKLIYRGEGEGVYNWGPREFRTSDAYRQLLESARWAEPIDQANLQTEPVFNPPFSCTLQTCPNVPAARQRLRDLATVRNRLFQAYVDVASGPVFLRIGRQNLVWGETDAFRLLDYINPVDSSFGGFLIALDERRVPLDMIRASYRLGEFRDFISEAQIEAYISPDNDVSFYPGTPAGSPWTLPNLGAPSGTTYTFAQRPAYSMSNPRGGARLLWNMFDATFSIAHYYTYHDNPLLTICVAPQFPIQRVTTATGGSGEVTGCPEGATNLPIQQPSGANPNNFAILAPQSLAVQQAARIQISGITSTFQIPQNLSRALALSGEPVVRTELAYIKDEPYYRQSNLDPFNYHFDPNRTGQDLNVSGNERRDSVNFVLGLDTNQFIRFLNPQNSFFISTQFFYKHIKKHDDDAVLPVPVQNVAPAINPSLGAVQPQFAKQYANQYLQTLLISTAYFSGQVNPSTTFFYDWGGSFVWIPSVTFWKEPFRFTVQYNLLAASNMKGNSGTSLLRDRDNLLFQLEYVI